MCQITVEDGGERRVTLSLDSVDSLGQQHSRTLVQSSSAGYETVTKCVFFFFRTGAEVRSSDLHHVAMKLAPQFTSFTHCLCPECVSQCALQCSVCVFTTCSATQHQNIQRVWRIGKIKGIYKYMCII